MDEERAFNKAERLLQIEALLLAHPEGLTQSEIARRLGVNRSTIHRYLPDLKRFHIYETGDDRLAVNRDAYLTQVRLTLHEALALHLAARLMANQTDKHNPHAAAALRKLGIALERLAPLIAEHLKTSAEVMDDAARYHDPVYLEVLETLAQAWSMGHKVRLKYQPPGGEVQEYVFAPYFIEPYAAGLGAHAIGWCDTVKALRTFKLERIRMAHRLAEPYTIPADFDVRALLRDAWGIWYSERDPVTVRVRFHPRVAARVQESRWHASQVLTPQPDGSLLWEARVAEPREMLPWLRGWGSDAEVLAPEELRAALIREVRRLAAMYEVGAGTVPLYQRLWAKTDRKQDRTHPLICHLLDVAAVTAVLWEAGLTDGIRGQMAAALGLDPAATGATLAFWAGCHDLGKASPAFQRKYAPAEAELTAAGLSFPRRFVQETCPHGTITVKTLPAALAALFNFPDRLARGGARAVGGHHGLWPTAAEVQALKGDQLGDATWDAVRIDLVRALQECFPPGAPVMPGKDREEQQLFLALLSGLTSVADWVGSMERYFPYDVEPPVDLRQYAADAVGRARRALTELGWLDWRPPRDDAVFQELFPFAPNPMQQAVAALAERLDRPGLVIIEAPTGSGKTEAALYLADHWARTLAQRGLYVAMPTLATSNQMHRRVTEVLARRYPGAAAGPLLIHSQARWNPAAPPTPVEIQDDRPESSTETMAWFLPRKRSLLAPLAVGTVDQALLGVLQARHFFVRLLGLSHKTLIFDEVHAYDTYMSALFQRLLGWLRGVGASVVLLSATLPAETRRQLVAAYVGHPVTLPGTPYPAVTWATAGAFGAVALPPSLDRRVALSWIGREPEETVAVLERELREGGCAAVICNTVGRAQAVYQAVQAAGLVPPEALILFHARYPFVWRNAIEREVVERFGKSGRRPRRAIVVATQVIEQSLDLDFDFLISDLAPIDLLVQRAGRLHRHPGRVRPAPVADPRVCVAVAENEEREPDFGRDGFIYEPYWLLRSYQVLQPLAELALPSQTPALIEAVYGPESDGAAPPALIPLLEAARERLRRNQKKADLEAQVRLIPEAGAEELLTETGRGLEEDHPDLHTALQALTRLAPPGIALVCLHRTAGGLETLPEGGVRVDPAEAPDAALTAALAGATVELTHYPAVQFFRGEAVPAGWARHPLLRDHRAAVFTGGVCPLPGTGYELRLTRELGLEIKPIGKEA